MINLRDFSCIRFEKHIKKALGYPSPVPPLKKFNSNMPLTIAYYEHYLMNFLSGKCTIKREQYKIHFVLSSVSTL